MTPIRLLIADGQPDRRARLTAALARAGGFEVVAQARGGPEALAQARTFGPDLALLADDLPPDGGCAATAALAPTCPAVLIGGEAGPDALRRAMRAGARDLLPFDLPPDALGDALRAVGADAPGPAPASRPSPARGLGRVVALAGAKGGAGRTTLAVNLAATLARDGDGPTLLLDLHAQFGAAALLLGLTPRRTLADLARLDPEALDARLLQDHLESHECGLRVLAGADAPGALDALSPPLLERLLALARDAYASVVLDLPTALHPASLAALGRADDVLLVCDLADIGALAAARAWLDALAGPHVRPEAVRVVLNRVPTRGPLTPADAARVLGRPVHALIPDGGRVVPDATNAGVPFALSAPGGVPARAVRALARSLRPEEDAAPAARPRAGLSLFGASPRRERGHI